MPTTDPDLENLLGHAQRLLAQGAIAEAARIFQDLRRNSAHESVGLEGLAMIAIQGGEPAQAIGYLEDLLEKDNDRPDVHYHLGIAHAEAGNPDRAVEAYRRAIDLDRGFVEAWYNLGITLSLAGRFEGAVEALRATLELRPDLEEARYALAAAYVGTGDGNGAVDICDAAGPRHCEMLALKPFALAAAGRIPEARAFADYKRFVSAMRVSAPSGYDSVAAFNKALVEHILAHPSLEYAPALHATVNGKHSGNLLAEPKGPFAEFEAMLWCEVETYRAGLEDGSSHPFLAPRDLGELHVWAIVMESGGHQIQHIHPTAWVSGVYYAEVPDFNAAGGESDQGWIEFGAPPPEIPYSGEEHRKLVEPREGLLLFFPAFFYHRTIPYEVSAPRVSIAFDFRPAS